MAPKKDTEDGIAWNNENIILFCEVCIDYFTNNGRGQMMRWRDIEELFMQKIGKRHAFKSLKNKYDSMKKDWCLWKFLKTGETGLGWNPTTGKLDCSDDWWERKLKEKPEANKYRHKGVCPLLEEKWDQLFGDDRIASLDHQEGTFWQNLSEEVSSNPPPTNSVVPKPTKTMKRRKRESWGSDLMREHIQQVQKIYCEIVDLIKQRRNNKKDEIGASIDQMMDIMNGIVANSYIEVGEDIWCHAMLMFRDPTNRELFFKMPSDDARLAWLKFAQTRNIF